MKELVHQVQCPRCGKMRFVRDENKNKRVKCFRCRTRLAFSTFILLKSFEEGKER